MSLAQEQAPARPSGGERTILVQVYVDAPADEAVAQEFELLAEAAGAEVLKRFSFNRHDVDPRCFIGSGQAAQIAEAVSALEAELVMVNAPLSPAQERNLERVLKARVLDRSGLVLAIFAQRARSHEGKLQVELAQLKHLSTRLVRGWTHLERQKGGIGLRGPGETQLETDRRLLGARIKQLQARLQKVSQQRHEVRKSRSALPTVALAGYTNSGKSTLFNALTRAEVLAKNQLFATLDPTWRKLNHAGQATILMADTVGFVSDLPHELVEAFQSTLEETVHAQLILLVIDVSDAERLQREQVVHQVLSEIGAAQVPCIRVYNKIDQSEHQAAVLRDADGKVHTVFVSALTGEGLEALQEAIVQHFHHDDCRGWLRLPPEESALRAQCYRERWVEAEHYDAEGHCYLLLSLAEKHFKRLQSQYNQTFQLLNQLPED